RRKARRDVHHRATRKVEHAPLRQKAIGVPGPVRQRAVDEQAKKAYENEKKASPGVINSTSAEAVSIQAMSAGWKALGAASGWCGAASGRGRRLPRELVGHNEGQGRACQAMGTGRYGRARGAKRWPEPLWPQRGRKRAVSAQGKRPARASLARLRSRTYRYSTCFGKRTPDEQNGLEALFTKSKHALRFSQAELLRKPKKKLRRLAGAFYNFKPFLMPSPAFSATLPAASAVFSSTLPVLVLPVLVTIFFVPLSRTFTSVSGVWANEAVVKAQAARSRIAFFMMKEGESNCFPGLLRAALRMVVEERAARVAGYSQSPCQNLSTPAFSPAVAANYRRSSGNGSLGSARGRTPCASPALSAPTLATAACFRAGENW
nr:hypothetical protein [Tanacetum cinerariifolium]